VRPARRWRIGLAALLPAVLWAATAAAQSCDAPTTVTVSFGAYDEASASPTNGTGQIRVICDPGTPYNVSFDAGAHSGGSFSPRAMTDAGSLYQLQYNLFVDSAHTRVSGDGTGGTETVPGTVQGAQDIIQIYGQIFPLQPVGVGAYADTIVVTVEF
jgi:spore coat protein U-like protein